LLYCIVVLFIYNTDRSRSGNNADFQVQGTERDIMEHKKELDLNLECDMSWLPGVVYCILWTWASCMHGPKTTAELRL